MPSTRAQRESGISHLQFNSFACVFLAEIFDAFGLYPLIERAFGAHIFVINILIIHFAVVRIRGTLERDANARLWILHLQDTLHYP